MTTDPSLTFIWSRLSSTFSKTFMKAPSPIRSSDRPVVITYLLFPVTIFLIVSFAVQSMVYFARPASCKRPSRPVARFALLRSCDGVHNLGHRTRLQEGDRQRHYPAQQ
jgi:hypothetical protein